MTKNKNTTEIGVIAPKTEVFIYFDSNYHTMKPEDKIYRAYFETKKDKLYFNEIKDHSNLSDSSLSATLLRLCNDGILTKEAMKSNTYYHIKNKKMFGLRFSILATQKFNNLHYNIKVPLLNFLKNIPEHVHTIILYGSASRGEEKKGSDIDIMVVSNMKVDLKKNIKEGMLTSKYHLSVVQINLKEFLEGNDTLLLEAKKTGFPIFHEQNFYEAVLDGY